MTTFLDPTPARSLAIRAVCLYAPAAAAMLLHLTRRSRPRTGAAVLLGLLWTLPALLALQELNLLVGWWTFQTAGPTLRGMPVELYLGWCCLWGAIPALALQRLSPIAKIAVMVLLDLAVMPLCAPVVVLSPHWLIGEALAAAFVLAPAIFLQHWTLEARHPGRRAAIQLATAAGIFLFLFPELFFAIHGGSWAQTTLHGWRLAIALQAVAFLALPGISAVQEFAERGRGTPIPYDPPRRLVTSGIYRYVANPMQLSCTLVLIAWGAIFGGGSWWLASAGFISFLYSAGVARWDEAEDLCTRFGQPWLEYRTTVHDWRLRLRPFAEEPPAYLFIDTVCPVCTALCVWLKSRNPFGLELSDSADYPTLQPRRLRYVPAGYELAEEDTTEKGIRALARALEHLHLGWALAGIIARIPGLRWAIQIAANGVRAGKPKVAPPPPNPAACTLKLPARQPTLEADDAGPPETSLPSSSACLPRSASPEAPSPA